MAGWIEEAFKYVRSLSSLLGLTFWTLKRRSQKENGIIKGSKLGNTIMMYVYENMMLPGIIYVLGNVLNL